MPEVLDGLEEPDALGRGGAARVDLATVSTNRILMRGVMMKKVARLYRNADMYLNV